MRMRHLAGVLVVGGIVAAMAEPVWSTKNSAVLTGRAGESLLKQCSRWAPAGVVKFWQPRAEQLAALEKRLPDALFANVYPYLKSQDQYRKPTPPLPKFFLQYVGVMLGVKQEIYINAFSEDEIGFNPDWRTKAVVVCDGGAHFWGAIFDPQSKSFSAFAFNGIA